MKKYMKYKFAEESHQASVDGASKPQGDGPEKGKAPPLPNIQPPLPNIQPPLPNIQPPLPNIQPPLPNIQPPLPNIQPPLPPDPPPTDIPLSTIFKREIVDDEYNQKTTTDQMTTGILEETRSEALITEYKTEPADRIEKETMCRNYIRGRCARGRSCMYAHKVILSQLEGVYRFCNDFQNTVCAYRKCKFVHATIFEKEHFYRSGYLPPHALSHLKEYSHNLPPPQPPLPPLPPPMSPQPESTQQLPFVFNSPPPPIYGDPSTSAPVLNYPPAPNLLSPVNIYSAFQNEQTTEPSLLKRNYSIMDVYGPMPPVYDCNESVPKKAKCNNCEINELRAQYSRSNMEAARRASEEMHRKLDNITMKSNRLFEVMASLIKPLNQVSSNTNYANLLAKLLLSSITKSSWPLDNI